MHPGTLTAGTLPRNVRGRKIVVYFRYLCFTGDNIWSESAVINSHGLDSCITMKLTECGGIEARHRLHQILLGKGE